MILSRRRDITIIVKSESQLTVPEQHEWAYGFARALLLEIVILVPFSAALVLWVVAPFVQPSWIGRESHDHVFYGLLGLVSYGFPFTAIKKFLMRVVRNELERSPNLRPSRDATEPEQDAETEIEPETETEPETEN